MALIELHEVSKTYDLGEVQVHALSRGYVDDRGRRVRGVDRPVRIRKINPDEYPGLSGSADERQLPPGR